MAVTVCASWSRLVQVIVVPALTVTVAGENTKFSIDTALVATGTSWLGASAAAGAAAPGAAAVAGLPQPARTVNPVTAGITSPALNWYLMIDPSPLAGPPDAGLTYR